MEPTMQLQRKIFCRLRMRLIRYLASAGVASRRKCESIITGGRVTVNGKDETDPFRIISTLDSVELDQTPVKMPIEKTVVMLNKPASVVTTANDTHGRKTVLDLVSNIDTRLFSVGRLDKETTGILLLTNDGDLAYRLTHPKFGVEKIYEATTDRFITDAEICSISSGVDIGEGETGQAEVVDQTNTANGVKITMKLLHGKKREIRRIFREMGLELTRLHRITFACLELGNLASGKHRILSDKERRLLAKTVDLL